jgi:hypothetical protein
MLPVSALRAACTADDKILSTSRNPCSQAVHRLFEEKNTPYSQVRKVTQGNIKPEGQIACWLLALLLNLDDGSSMLNRNTSERLY